MAKNRKPRHNMANTPRLANSASNVSVPQFPLSSQMANLNGFSLIASSTGGISGWA
jgi:hypothetical protein